MISVVMPSYGRADRIKDRVQNCQETLSDSRDRIVVVVEPEQELEYSRALADTKAGWLVNTRSKNYAGAINTAIGLTTSDYIFLAADDLNFHPGWDTQAMHTMLALPHIRVVGTNDLLNGYVLQGWHATHYLVDKRYLESPGGVIDGDRGHALFEGYDHNYTDTEFIGTAKARAVFAPCLTSTVEHLHPTVGKGVADATFEKTQGGLQKDHDLYESRKHKWWGLSK